MNRDYDRYENRRKDDMRTRHNEDYLSYQQKKKKKSKDRKHSKSRSRSHHKKRYSKQRGRQDLYKHKKEGKHKEHKEHKEAKEHKEQKDRKEYRQTYPYNENLKQVREKNGAELIEKRYHEPRILDDKDPHFEDRKEIQRIRRTNPQQAEQMEVDLEKKIIFEKKQKQYDDMKEKFKEAQKEMEEAKRQDHTILVYCLPLKAKEKDIWNFFLKTSCGRIRDIRIIKDGRSGKSKGVAYVQFYTSQSVEKALTMSERPFQLKGREFMGLRIQHSQAEKNRAAAAAKQMRVTKPVDPLQQAQENMKRQMKVFVGGLTDKLAQIQESQLKELFEPFGPIDYVDIHRDPQTGQCKGFAFIQYSNTEDAKTAVKDMNNLKVGGQTISVQTVNVAQKGQVSTGDEYLHSQSSKAALMNKLSRDAPTHSNLSRPPISTVSTPYLLLTNLFKMEGTTPIFFQELKKQVMSQCSEYGIVQKCFVEKNNQGNVWVKFTDTQAALKAQEKLNGKFFDESKIFCYFVTQNTYQNRVVV